MNELYNFLYKRGNKILKVQLFYDQELDLRYDLAIVSNTLYLLFSIKTTNEELPLHLVKHHINLITSVYHYFPKSMNNGIYLRGSMGIGVFYKEQGKKSDSCRSNG